MITDLDKNKSGNIDFEEFLDMMTARMSDKDTREDINKVFRLFDDDTSGSITIRNLRRVARELGETMTDEELQEMIERADSNGDGAVSMDDFYNIMTKKTFTWALKSSKHCFCFTPVWERTTQTGHKLDYIKLSC